MLDHYMAICPWTLKVIRLKQLSRLRHHGRWKLEVVHGLKQTQSSSYHHCRLNLEVIHDLEQLSHLRTVAVYLEISKSSIFLNKLSHLQVIMGLWKLEAIHSLEQLSHLRDSMPWKLEVIIVNNSAIFVVLCLESLRSSIVSNNSAIFGSSWALENLRSSIVSKNLAIFVVVCLERSWSCHQYVEKPILGTLNVS